MAVDYIPDTDAEFADWQANFVLYAGDNAAALGLTSAQITQLNTLSNDWSGANDLVQSTQAAASAAVQSRRAARVAEEADIRALTAQIQARPATTDAQRAALGITVPGASPAPPDPPVSQPVLTVDTSVRLVHTISFADAGTPTRKAKPAGVMACEIWHKVGGAAPVGVEGMTFLAVDTATPYVAHYEAADVGQMVYYVGRWLSTTSAPGEWGTTIPATVGG